MSSLNSKVCIYREIRRAVWKNSTHSDCVSEHVKNQQRFRHKLEQLCSAANIEDLQGSSDEVKNQLWRHLWTKIRYAGIKSTIAAKEVEDICFMFDNYEIFTKSDWDIEIAWNGKHEIEYAGSSCLDFLNRTGEFSGKQTIGNLVKLKKTVDIARKYSEHVQGKQPLDFILANHEEGDVWGVHRHLQDIGYTKDLTALHFMMDIGLQVIKPDIVITRLFLELKWLHDIVPNLPKDLSKNDLVGKGRYKSKYKYTNAKIYRPIIDLAIEIVSRVDKADLVRDIGWATDNPIREFDLFLVKAGQVPDNNWGLTANLAKSEKRCSQT